MRSGLSRSKIADHLFLQFRNNLNKNYSMKKFIFFSILSVLVLRTACAFTGDNDNLFSKRNAVYLGLFGNSFFYPHISYDRILYAKENFQWVVGSGFWVAGGNFDKSRDLILSPQSSFMLGRKHHLEAGLGYSLALYNLSDSQDNNDYAIMMRIGYRYQKPDGGFFFRTGFTPSLRNSIFSAQFFPWAGISIGGSF